MRPGMFVQVELTLGAPQMVLSVPQKALLGQKGLQYVFTIEDDRAKKVRVEAGDLIGDRIEVRAADGGATISEGMVVVSDNLDKIKDGDLLETEGAS